MKTLILAAVLALPLQAAAAADWQQIETADSPGEIATWVRDVQDSPVREFRGEVVLPVGPLPVLALLVDADSLDEWIFQCRHSERLADTSGDFLYLQFDLPWPVANRDVVLENSLTLDGRTLQIRSQSRQGMRAEQEALVRIPALDNRFLVTPLKAGQTRVVFRTFVDPGGSVPAWLSNFVSTKAPLVTLRGMREKVQQPPWVDAGWDDIPVLPAFRALDLKAWLNRAGERQ